VKGFEVRANVQSLRFDWVPGWMAVILLMGIWSAVNLWQDVGRPFGGFLTARDVMRNTWRPDIVTPSWWPGMVPGELSQRDGIIAIDGLAMDANQGAVYAEAYRQGRSTVGLTLTDDMGATRQWDAPLVVFTATDFLDVKIPDLIVGLAFWLLALLVYRARPEEPANRLFAVVCSVIAGHRWLFSPTIFLYETATARLMDLVMGTMIAPFIGSLTIHFVLLFPEPHRILDLRFWPFDSAIARRSPIHVPATVRLFPALLYGLTGAVAGASAISKLLHWQTGWTPLVAWLDGMSFRISLLTVAAALVLGLSRYSWLWLKGRGPRLRRQAAVIMVGFCLASLWLVPFLVDGLTEQYQYPFFWSDLDLRYVLIAVPLAFSYVILRYQTFRRTNPLFVAVFALAASALMASTGAWLLSWWGGFGHSTTIFLILLVSNLALSIFWSRQGVWQGAFGRLLHWETQSYTAARHFGRRLVDEIEQPDLPDRIAAAIVAELELEQAAVWLRSSEHEPYALAGTASSDSATMRVESGPATRNVTELQTAGVKKGKRVQSEAEIMKIHNAELAIPLVAAGQAVGLLVVGKRWDEEIFDERDQEIVELIGQQAALFLLVAQQVDELRQAPAWIAEAQERERTRIAQELHDTVQQFLGRLPFFLETARDTIRTAPEETVQLLQRCIADVDEAAGIVRQIRNNLAPSQLEKGLLGPLHELVERFQARTGICTRLELHNGEPSLSLLARHALYRIIQQALDNTVAHAYATQVTITLAKKGDRLMFVIGDDGCGSSEAELAQARERGSYGLQSMNSRITAVGGEFLFTSASGAGTVISGWLPLATA
jgi:signal transduction histidine kinase